MGRVHVEGYESMRCAVAVLFCVAAATAQEAAEKPTKATCPVTTGGYNAFVAAANEAAKAGDIGAYEAGLRSAITSTQPAWGALSQLVARKSDPAQAAALSRVAELISYNGESVLLHTTNLLSAGRVDEALPRANALVNGNPNSGPVLSTAG